MGAPCQSIQSSSQKSLYPSEESAISVCGRIVIAIGIIVLLGSLVTNGCLFAQLGNYSFIIGACGFALGILSIVLALCICRTSLDAHAAHKKKEHAEEHKKAAQDAQAKVQAKQEEARKNGPIDSNKFRTDENYRSERLSNNNWFSNVSAQNKELILCIDVSEFPYVQYEQLPETVKKDFYEALVQSDINKASEFFSNKLSLSVVNMMERHHLEMIYGRDTALLKNR